MKMPDPPKSNKESWITSVKGNEPETGAKKYVRVEITESDFNIGDTVKVTVEKYEGH